MLNEANTLSCALSIYAALVHGPEWALLAHGMVSWLGNWGLWLECGSWMAASSGRKVPWAMGLGVGTLLRPRESCKRKAPTGKWDHMTVTEGLCRGWGWRVGELSDLGLEVRLLTLAADEMIYTIRGSFREPVVCKDDILRITLKLFPQTPCSISKFVWGGGRSL